MKISVFLAALPLVLAEVFPLNSLNKPAIVTPYAKDDEVAVECIQRQIDNGEHKFDAEGNIVYAPFSVCSETGKPLSFKYGVNKEINCTIALTDETYHLFQLYVHEDAPFSCRVPHSKTYKDASIPFTLNFRGHLETSHLDIDTALNVVAHKRSDGALMAITGYAAGTETKRYIIGDLMTIQFSVSWIDEYHKTTDTFFNLDTGFSSSVVTIITLGSAAISAVIVFVILYGKLNRKLVKELGYSPGFTTELGLDKKD